MSEFVRSASVLSVSTIANAVRGIFSGKVLAVALGPSLTGVFSQILNFSSFLAQLTPVGLTAGVSKMVAESPRDAGRVGSVIGTAGGLSFAAAVASAAILLPFSAQISEFFVGTQKYRWLFIATIASLPLINLSGVLSYVLQGLADVRRLTVANVATAASSLALVVPATLIFGLPGAVLSAAASAVFQTAFMSAAVAGVYRQQGWPFSSIAFSAATAKTLMGYAGVLFISGIGAWGSLLLVRTIAVRDIGAFANGIYQAVWAISSQYMTVYVLLMATYVFPRVVASGPARLESLLNATLRGNIMIMVPLFVAIVSMRELIVRLLYSQAFMPATQLLSIQVLGDFARVIGWSFGISLFARGRARGFLLAMLTQDLVWVASAPLAVHVLGTVALATTYSVSSLAWPLLMYPMARYWFAVRIDAVGTSLCALSLGCIAVAVVLPGMVGLVVAPVVPLVLLYANRSGRLSSNA